MFHNNNNNSNNDNNISDTIATIIHITTTLTKNTYKGLRKKCLEQRHKNHNRAAELHAPSCMWQVASSKLQVARKQEGTKQRSHNRIV